MTLVLVKDGVVLNNGEWDECKVSVVVGYDAPWPGPMAEPEGYDPQPIYEDVVTNPFPEGAEYVDTDVLITAKGRMVLATDYQALREDEYPSTEERLLAYLTKQNDAMEAKIAAIDAKYPAP